MMTRPPSLPAIPILDCREGGPVEHARRSRAAMLRLREACFSTVPGPVRGLAGTLDRVSEAWLRRSASPYVPEIAAIAGLAGTPGVFFINASYEWGCTTRIDPDQAPTLRRTLDWPFPGLGRFVEVALQQGEAGPFANVTWPGAAGVLTALAPGRFAAAINQAPMYRRSSATALLPADVLLNAVGTWRRQGRWPPAHLLRHVFESCATYEAAVEQLASAPLAKPALFSLVGIAPGQGCLIERTEDEAHLHHGPNAIANDWHPAGPGRPGTWLARGTLIRGPRDSEERRDALLACTPAEPFDWLREPVLNGLTRLAVEMSPASGALSVVGFEPTSRRLRDSVAPATARLQAVVRAEAIEPTVA